MLLFDTTEPLPPHVIDQIRRRQKEERQREDERRLPLELHWVRLPVGSASPMVSGFETKATVMTAMISASPFRCAKPGDGGLE